MLFLDDANVENGCLEVLPGSHRQGVWATREDGDFFAHNEIDRDVGAAQAMVPLEVPAGSVAYFGPYLVHQSAPNTSATERRSILYSYQPAGSTHMLESFRALARR
jgi:ectoine hydroxylase